MRGENRITAVAAVGAGKGLGTIMSLRPWFYLLSAVVLGAPPGVIARDAWVYFGTFTNALSRGIYVAKLDGATGALSAPELAAALPNPPPPISSA